MPIKRILIGTSSKREYHIDRVHALALREPENLVALCTVDKEFDVSRGGDFVLSELSQGTELQMGGQLGRLGVH